MGHSFKSSFDIARGYPNWCQFVAPQIFTTNISSARMHPPGWRGLTYFGTMVFLTHQTYSNATGGKRRNRKTIARVYISFWWNVEGLGLVIVPSLMQGVSWFPFTKSHRSDQLSYSANWRESRSHDMSYITNDSFKPPTPKIIIYS